jgi:hypothetical protein
LYGRSKKNELQRASFSGLNGGGFQKRGRVAGDFLREPPIDAFIE